MRKAGGGIAQNVERGMNDFTFEPLPDFGCFWFGPGGPERCFLLEDLLPLIMVQHGCLDFKFLLQPSAKSLGRFKSSLRKKSDQNQEPVYFSR